MAARSAACSRQCSACARGEGVSRVSSRSLEMSASRNLQKRAHALIPGGAPHLRQGRRPVPGDRAAVYRARLRLATSGTSTATSTSSTAWAIARSASATRYAPVVEAVRARARSAAATSRGRRPSRSSAPRQFLSLVDDRRDGEVLQGRLGRDVGRRPARPRLYRPRPGRDLRRPSVLLHRRLVHRHDRRCPPASRQQCASSPWRSATTISSSLRALFAEHPGQIACRDPRAGAHRRAARPASSQAAASCARRAARCSSSTR